MDVPALDGVAFIDPRRSTIDIAQAVGRAIRKSADKSVGTIVLPVFVEQTAERESALDSSAFKPVWDVLRALRAHDETLAEQLDSLRREMGRGTVGTLALPGRISLDLPVTVGEEFVRAFEARLVEQTTASWEFWFGLLLGFAEREGHARVPVEGREGEHRLGEWAHAQRQFKKKGQLSLDRASRLETLPGWSWDPFADDWEEGYLYLTTFVTREGHARIPYLHGESDFRLGQWVTVQRHANNTGKLSPERVARLAALPGWSWDPLTDDWEEGLRRLVAFVEHEGNARVPKDYREGDFRLGQWVSTQRQVNKKAQLSSEQISRLEALPGWSWDPHAEEWEEGFRHLADFVQREGHARVPWGRHEGEFRLGILGSKAAASQQESSTESETSGQAGGPS